MFAIKAKKRDGSVNVDILRKDGELPAVFYGAGRTAISISVPVASFKKLWREAGESSTVKISFGKDDVDALIHEVQTDPVTEEPIHADFLAIDMNKKIRVKVPFVFEGVSNAVKNGLGNLVKVLHEIEVEALPKNLPHNLVVHISKLETLEDNIIVSDIKLGAGVEIIAKGNEIVASIVAQVEEKEEIVAPSVDLSAIEVEKKGKKEKEGDEAQSGGAPSLDASSEASKEKPEKK